MKRPGSEKQAVYVSEAEGRTSQAGWNGARHETVARRAEIHETEITERSRPKTV
jgi:hypothetical protein